MVGIAEVRRWDGAPLFGARVFYPEPTPPDGSAHSSYWDPDRGSLARIVDIAGGHGR